jgi:hypothetical protein
LATGADTGGSVKPSVASFSSGVLERRLHAVKKAKDKTPSFFIRFE